VELELDQLVGGGCVGDLDPDRRGGRLADRGGGNLDPLGRRWRGSSTPRSTAALVLAAAQELGVIAVVGGAGRGSRASRVLLRERRSRRQRIAPVLAVLLNNSW
jgi:hypothetical protein